MNNQLNVEGIKVGYDKKIIIPNLDIKIPSNKVSVIIGSNACGKSTLLKTCARLLMPIQGAVKLDGKKINDIPTKELAKQLGILPQSPSAPDGLKVIDLVARGRFPYQSFMGSLKQNDYDAIDEALEMMDIKSIANKDVNELSGGQRQRVWIAMALAQDSDILFLDEPTTYLDIRHQIDILDMLRLLNKKKGTTIVMVLHDINLSSRYSDHMIVMKKGHLIAEGNPCKIINETLIKNVFDLDSVVINDPISNTPLVVPCGKYHKSC